MQLRARPQGATAANTRSGRRILTARGQVLLLSGDPKIQLQILDETGARPPQQYFPAAEAVINAEGSAVVYVDALVGRLRWIDVTLQTDEDLAAPVTGLAPALSRRPPAGLSFPRGTPPPLSALYPHDAAP